MPRPRMVPRTIKRAAINPITSAATVAHRDKIKLFRMLQTASGCDMAVDQPSSVKDAGRIVPYHPPGSERLARMVLMCGNPATHTTPPTKIQHSIVPSQPTFFSSRRTLALDCMACAFPPTAIFPAMYNEIETTNITATSANGRRLDCISFKPSKICTLVTLRNSNINGVPSSVKLQMNTITAPANAPGVTNGTMMRRNRVHAPAPRLHATSSRAGSKLARAAVKFKYTIGYSDNISSTITAQNPPRPVKSIPS